MDQVLKAYKYISDAKVDVLYAQIPRGLLDGIAVDLNLDLKLAVVEASAAVKRTLPSETRYSRLQVVVNTWKSISHPILARSMLLKPISKVFSRCTGVLFPRLQAISRS